MTLIDSFKNQNIAVKSTAAFWGAYAVCSGIIAGGRMWIHLTDSSLKVSELLGTVGKATFRRQAATFAAVSYVAYRAMESLLSKTRLKDNQRVVQVISAATGLACGALAGATVSHPVFTVIKFATVAVPLAYAAAHYMLPHKF